MRAKRAFTPATLANLQLLLAVKPAKFFVVHCYTLPFQHHTNAPVSKPTALLGDTPNSGSKVSVIGPYTAIAYRRSVNL
jgi:hypothetical protein